MIGTISEDHIDVLRVFKETIRLADDFPAIKSRIKDPGLFLAARRLLSHLKSPVLELGMMLFGKLELVQKLYERPLQDGRSGRPISRSRLFSSSHFVPVQVVLLSIASVSSE